MKKMRTENYNHKSTFSPHSKSSNTPVKNKINNEEKLINVFGENIIQIINSFSEIHSNTKTYLNNISQEIDKKFTDFNQEIYNHIDSTANKYIKAFKPEDSSKSLDDNAKSVLIQDNSKNYLKTFQKIISLYNQIFESIKENISILTNFLEISKLLDKEKPIQEFLSNKFNDIIESWMFLKLDLEKFNFLNALKNSQLSMNMKEFISKVCKGQNLVMNIGQTKWDIRMDSYMINKEKEKERESKIKSKKLFDNKMIKENCHNLIKIKISNIKNITKYFDNEIIFPKAKSLLIDNVSNLSDNFLSNFPKLEKLQIKYCPSLENCLMSNLSNNITKLYLTNNNFVDCDFNSILSNYIIKNNNIRNNLKVLSFANNDITKADFDALINRNETFKELKEIDLHKNKLYKLNFNPNDFPELKFINCCRNNFEHFCFKTIKNIIIMQSGNDFLTDEELYKEYYTDLSEILNNSNSYPLKYLNISYLPSIYSNKYLSELNITYSICINLNKLDLSYNKLKSETFFKFAKNNRGCLNLKTLNLSGNDIDDTFFEIYLKNDIKNIFSKLQHLYLSDNKIGINNVIVNYKDNIPIYDTKNENDIYKLRLLYKFIEENKHLSKLNITKNPIKEKLIIKYEPNGAAHFSEKYIIKEEKNDKIIINCFYSFLMKIINDLLSNEDYKLERTEFVLIFDCNSWFNLNSKTYPFGNYPIIFNK